MSTHDVPPHYPLSAVLKRHGPTIDMDDRIACRRCPNADWIVEISESEYGDDVSARTFCAALGRQVYPTLKVRDCDARRKAIDAEQFERE